MTVEQFKALRAMIESHGVYVAALRDRPYDAHYHACLYKNYAAHAANVEAMLTNETEQTQPSAPAGTSPQGA